MSVGENIKKAREEKGWSQTELSNKTGISCASISSYESGKWNPQADYLQRIADALGTTTAALSLGIEDAKPVVESVKPTVVRGAPQPVEHKIVLADEPVRYNVKDKEDLQTLNLLIRHIQDLKICRDEKRKVYKIVNDIRCSKEMNILFGEEK